MAEVFDDRSAWGAHALRGFERALLGLAHRVPAVPGGRRVALWLRHPLKHRLRGPVDAVVWGLRLRLMPRGNLSESRLLFLPGFVDRVERRELARRLGAGSVFFDVGANAGLYSFWASRLVGDSGRVVAVEPDGEMRRRVGFNLAANGVRNVTVCGCAVSDRSGEARLAVGEKNRGENRIEDTGEGEAVVVRTLTELCEAEGVGRIDGMKIDIEGHEVRALRHFFEHAERGLWPRVLIFEDHGDAGGDGVRALVEGVGYREVCRGRLNRVHELRGDG